MSTSTVRCVCACEWMHVCLSSTHCTQCTNKNMHILIVLLTIDLDATLSSVIYFCVSSAECIKYKRAKFNIEQVKFFTVLRKSMLWTGVAYQ